MQIKAMPETPNNGFPVWARVVMVTAYFFETKHRKHHSFVMS